MSDLEAIRQRTEDKKRKLEEIRKKRAQRDAASSIGVSPTATTSADGTFFFVFLV